jgi:hypothetical protein
MSLTRVGLAHLTIYGYDRITKKKTVKTYPDQRLRPEARFLCLWGTIAKKLTQSSLPYKSTRGDEQLKEARSTFRM